MRNEFGGTDTPAAPSKLRHIVNLTPMQPNQEAFHTEEYKQIRSEVVGLVEKIDRYYQFIVIVPTAAYSWLIATSMGTYGMPGTRCLRIPLELVVLAWLIPPTFILGCGLILRALAARIVYMGTYLLTLESLLRASKLPVENPVEAPTLGWEKFNLEVPSKLTRVRKAIWTAVFAVCTAISIAGIVSSISISTYCPSKESVPGPSNGENGHRAHLNQVVAYSEAS